MLKRKAEKEIMEWIQSSKTALLVSGARQVGKTWSIRKCLQDANCDYLEVNLIEDPELIPALAQCSSVSDLVVMLSAAKSYSFKKGESVLFIDEVQECRDIVTKIKFWVDEGSYRYVLSGSLLGIELRSLRSVGYLSEIKMHPLDFEEFLIASGVLPDTIEHLQRCFAERKPVENLIHQKMMQHFRRYLVVGGMPGVKYHEHSLQMYPGSKLFVYTDGVPEATDAENALFGTTRMLEALNAHANESPKQILHGVRQAVNEFVSDMEQFDDLTMMCLEYMPKER